MALALLWRKPYRDGFATLSGWRFDPALFGRLMRFGLPSGFHWALDVLAFSVFIFLIGTLGDTALAASSIAFTINMVAFLPPFGLCQAVSVLVGQRLGEDRPDLAERSTWTGFRITWLYMAVVAAAYFFLPGLFLQIFQSSAEPEKWAGVSALVPTLLAFVALYSLFDGINLVFSSALKGAGDTWFVTIASVTMAWALMVVPTAFALWYYRVGLLWCWTFASAYIILVALVFLARFIQGKWKSMRVIEPPTEGKGE